MIRINLAQKKQASYVGGGKTGNITKGGGLGALKDAFGSAGKSDLINVLTKMLVPVVLCGFAFVGFNYYISQKSSEMAQELAAINKDKERLEDELKKIKGFESVKTQLDKNSQIIKIKIETVEKLVQGRDFTVKSLVALSQSIPKEVWLSEMTANETAYTLRGKAIDLGQVTDVMTHLGQSIYFKDVALRTSSMDVSGKFTNFELTARHE